MLRYLFKPYSVRRHSRESYLYADKQGRRAEIVVYEVPGKSPRFTIDDLALTHWLVPTMAELKPYEKADLLAKVQAHLGASVAFESSTKPPVGSASAA